MRAACSSKRTIDHTPADIILVDSFERKPIGRPWVTLAIDIATRMVTGEGVRYGFKPNFQRRGR